MHHNTLSAQLQPKSQVDLHIPWAAIALRQFGDAAMQRNPHEDNVYYSTDYSQEATHDKQRTSRSAPGSLMTLTIPGQPVGGSPSQRPTPLPGRSAGKHRCSPRGYGGNASANAGRMAGVI